MANARRYLAGFGLFLLMLLSGCSQDERVLERIGYIESSAYDLAPDGKLKVTFSVPLVTQYAREERPLDELLTTTTTSPKEAKQKLSLRTSRQLVSGQLRTLMFGADLARQGLRKHIDTILRDPSISKRTTILVVDGDAGELLSREYPRHSKTGRYIDNLMKKEFDKQSYPRIMLYHFLRDYFDDSVDPIATVIKTTGKDITISGIGLFHKDKYITEIPWKDAFIFSLLYTDLSEGEFSIASDDYPALKSVSLNSVSSKGKIKISKSNAGKYAVDIHLKVVGSVVEYLGNLRLSTAERHEVERQVAQYITREGERIVKLLQKNNVDSLGLGSHVRNKMSYEEWKQTDWHDMYRSMPVNVHCTFKIKNFGNFYD